MVEVVRGYEEYKPQIIELNKKKIGIHEIAKQLGVGHKRLSKWCKQEGIQIHRKVFRNTCSHCHKEYESIRYNNKYCSDRCRVKANKTGYKVQGLTRTVTCTQCSNEYIVPKEKGLNNLICKECRYKNKQTKHIGKHTSLVGWHNDIYIHTCKECGSYYLTNINLKTYYCSSECRTKSKRNPLTQKKCKECGKYFSTTRDNQVFCSSNCCYKYGHRQKEIIRRAKIISNGRVDWDISIKKLLKRDGRYCYLCKQPMKVNADTNDSLYPSIEHIKPISKGGTHTWDNVKLAHRKCNWEKGTKTFIN
ncbi:hypothetical protein BUY00_01530 [Staphylococcus chromogenes]|uniref:HNH endonuclease n=1 Tax=Staphylococcus chromogenes TaxID=46126 RepID=UPI000D1CC8AC|nr:HNH endonuclease [Staphylococcus chromogenes]PUZ23528.1 hypothetical protein BUY00_01530 [Staphylococcus chromogenes]TRL29942.1 hypothetical protein FNL21_04475 [Staphylococcus chromogenes]